MSPPALQYQMPVPSPMSAHLLSLTTPTMIRSPIPNLWPTQLLPRPTVIPVTNPWIPTVKNLSRLSLPNLSGQHFHFQNNNTFFLPRNSPILELNLYKNPLLTIRTWRPLTRGYKPGSPMGILMAGLSQPLKFTIQLLMPTIPILISSTRERATSTELSSLALRFGLNLFSVLKLLTVLSIPPVNQVFF